MDTCKHIATTYIHTQYIAVSRRSHILAVVSKENEQHKVYPINSRQKTNSLLKHPKYDITGVLNAYLVEENASNAIFYHTNMLWKVMM